MSDCSEYFESLIERMDSATRVPFREVGSDDGQPKLNDCHGNVESWAARHPAVHVVRGWLFWPPNDAGQYMFMAHSVIEENGQLFDITPIGPNTPREGLLFLRHTGTEEEFEAMKMACSQMFYPPMDFFQRWDDHGVMLDEDV